MSGFVVTGALAAAATAAGLWRWGKRKKKQ